MASFSSSLVVFEVPFLSFYVPFQTAAYVQHSSNSLRALVFNHISVVISFFEKNTRTSITFLCYHDWEDFSKMQFEQNIPLRSFSNLSSYFHHDHHHQLDKPARLTIRVLWFLFLIVFVKSEVRKQIGRR